MCAQERNIIFGRPMLDVDLLVNAINRGLQHPKLELNVSVAMVMSLKSCVDAEHNILP